MKKKIFAVMMVLICLAIAATGTLAYFTSEETAHNIITTGAVDIDLEEWQDLDGDGQNYTPYPPENPGPASAPDSQRPGSHQCRRAYFPPCGCSRPWGCPGREH